MNFLIFKNDRIGDLIFLSGVIKNIKLNFPNSKIILISSSYNFKVANTYDFVDQVIPWSNENIFKFYIKNKAKLNVLFENIFILDGKKNSILLTLFLKSKKKSIVCYKKIKKIFFLKFFNYRPSKLILKLFFSNYVYSDENYDNTENHYQKIYFELLENNNFQIYEKKNYFNLRKVENRDFDYIFNNYIKKKFCLLHYDDKINNQSKEDFEILIKKINFFSKNVFIVITTGLTEALYSNILYSKFNVFDVNIHLNKNRKIRLFSENKNILIIKNLDFELFAKFLSKSEMNISFHAGTSVHVSSALGKKFIDIIDRSKVKELSRWIPLGSKYYRITFDELPNIKFIDYYE